MPSTISKIQRDGNGRIIAWIEGAYSVTVTRDAVTSYPLVVRAQAPYKRTLYAQFNYGGDGALIGTSGTFQSDLLDELFDGFPIPGTPSVPGPITLVSGKMVNVPSVFRVSINGTGTIVISPFDIAGGAAGATYSETFTSAVNTIRAFCAEKAVQISASFPAELSAQLLV